MTSGVLIARLHVTGALAAEAMLHDPGSRAALRQPAARGMDLGPMDWGSAWC